MNKDIPVLGKTATEVYNNAFKIDTAGFELEFQTVFHGIYRIYRSGLEEIQWKGTIPILTGKKLSDESMVGLISRGEVSIFVVSPGKTPYYKREFHRATGKVIEK